MTERPQPGGKDTEGRSPLIVERRKSNGTRLIIVGVVDHTNTPSDPQIACIRSKFASFDQQTQGKRRLVLTEGGIWTYVPDETGSIQQDGEQGFLTHLATKSGIERATPEPSYETQVETLLTQGFSREEIMYYYFAREIPQIMRKPTLSPTIYRQALTDVLEKYKDRFRWEGFDFSIKHMNTIHTQLYPEGETASVDFFEKQTQRFNEEADLTRIQQVATATNALRNGHYLQEHKRYWGSDISTFSVCGENHAQFIDNNITAFF